MKAACSSNNGFALVAALLMLVILSAFSVAIVFLANSETQTHTTDLENTQVYYTAEAGMEKMMVDLNNLFLSNQTPSVSQIQAVGSTPPTLTGYTFPEYQLIVPNVSGTPTYTVRTISSGPNQGLVAQLLPITLATTARAGNGAEVRMTRDVELALIPVFQFASFSDTDLAYFPSQGYVSTGRVHTNGSLYMHTPAAQKIVFRSKVTAAVQVVRAEMQNRNNTVSMGWTGDVLFPTAAGGCNSNTAGPNCRDLTETEGSYTAVPPNGSVIAGWNNLSTNTYNSWVTSGSTGAKVLALPFVNSTLKPIEIIRRPPTGESASSPVGRSRHYNLAQIRVLLDDDKADLPGGASDPGNIWLENASNSGGPDYTTGVPVPDATNRTYFAEGTNTLVNAATAVDPEWIVQPVSGGAVVEGSGYRWPLLKGALRVEARRSDGTYVAVTQEWLELGFARGLAVPKVDTETNIPNSVHPNAIMIFQLQRDVNGNGDLADITLGETTATWNARFNWLPTNMYDPREGELRPGGSNGNCNVGGIMNTPELDVGNLKKWLAGTIGTTGTLVESTSQNGYVLYFSDRRGMLTTGGVRVGEYGFEDVINPGDSTGTPDSVLYAAEDVNQNGVLDIYGRANLGDGFSTLAQGTDSTTYDVPIYRVSGGVARKNRVTGARHGLMLINGSLGNVPVRPGGTGGFTVAVENGAYIRGNYNANNSGFGNPHSAAGVIADAVTTLSNNWSNQNSFTNSTTATNRTGTTTYHRCAIAAGKNRAFLKTDAPWSTDAHIGTDGGTATFMRYLERWTGNTHYYLGSLVSLYFAQYNVAPHGLSTASTYGAPTRSYDFDTDFLNPDFIPPGTPRFQDIVNLGYKQVFAP